VDDRPTDDPGQSPPPWAPREQILDAVSDAVVVTGLDGRIHDWNQAAERIFGFSQDEVLGRTAEFLHLETGAYDEWERGVAERVVRDGRWTGEIRFKRVDGTTVVAETTITAIRSGDHDIIGQLSVSRDVTQYHAATRQQEQSSSERLQHRDLVMAAEERERALAWVVEESRNELYLFDPSTLLFAVMNRAARENLGYAADEVPALTPLDLKPEFDRESFEALIAPLHQGEVDEVRFETLHRRRDGSTYPVDVHLQRSSLADQDMLLALIIDITDRYQAERDAHAAAERLRAVVETAVDGIITMSGDGIIHTVNTAACRIFGYAPDELVGRNVAVLMPEPYHSEHDTYLHNYHATGERKIIGIGREVSGRRKDGTTFPLELSVGEVSLEGERIFTGIIRDITNRRKAEQRAHLLVREQAAREAAEANAERAGLLAEISEALNSSLNYGETLDRLADVLVPRFAAWCVVDLLQDTGVLQQASTRALDVRTEAIIRAVLLEHPAGGLLSPQEVAQQPAEWEPRLVAEIGSDGLARLARDENHLQALRALQPGSFMTLPLAVRGKTLGILTLVRTATGPSYGTEDLAFALEVARRAAVAIDHAQLYRDTAEARRSAEKLAARSRQLHEIAAATTGALVPDAVADLVLTRILSSLGAEAAMLALLTGEDDSEFEVLRRTGTVGERHAAFTRFPVTSRLPVSDAVRLRKAIFVGSADLARAPYPDLQKFSECEAWAALPLLLEGEPIGAIGIAFAEPQAFLDEEREFLMAIAHHTAQALERARLFLAEKEARTRAEGATQARDEVLGIVAHDLRSPLSGIRMITSAVQQQLPADNRWHRSLDSVLTATGIMDQLIQDLLDVSRIEAGHLGITPEPMDIPPLLARALELFSPHAAAAGVTLTVDGGDAVPIVSGDPRRILQVLSNLVSNAIRFTQQGGTVSLCARASADGVQVEIADSGVGIEEEHLPHVFNRFWHRNNPTRGNAGLGLTIAKGIIEAHGGTLSAASEPGHGTTMTFTLPIEPGAVIADDPAPALRVGAHPERELAEGDAPTRILIVDDHPMVLRGLRELLSDDPRFEVVAEASTGEQALELTAAMELDVVVIDLTMPGMSGLDAIHGITEIRPEVRVLAITSDTAEESLLPVLAAGGSGFVRKTVEYEDLLDALLTVRRDGVYLDSGGARMLLQGYRSAKLRTGELFRNMSRQERDILRLVAEGYTSKEIGGQLHLSPHTVDTYRSQLTQRLGLTHRSEVVQYALQTGLLRPAADA